MERVIKQIIDKLDSIKHVKLYFLNIITLKWQTGKTTNKIKVNTPNVQSILINLKIHWKKTNAPIEILAKNIHGVKV